MVTVTGGDHDVWHGNLTFIRTPTRRRPLHTADIHCLPPFRHAHTGRKCLPFHSTSPRNSLTPSSAHPLPVNLRKSASTCTCARESQLTSIRHVAALEPRRVGARTGDFESLEPERTRPRRRFDSKLEVARPWIRNARRPAQRLGFIRRVGNPCRVRVRSAQSRSRERGARDKSFDSQRASITRC
ncbi:hypothetical protein C8R43DRAFT_1034589 [Mycena crocata]|nr:hypothetical protein C8R43DRAFT_1034589 [Mycena crocata]